MKTTLVTAMIRLLSIVLLIGFSSVVTRASAQSVVGVSEILSSTSASEIDTYSATELSYDVSLYYGAAVEGYLYDGATQIRSGYAQAQQLADGYLQAPVNVGDTYTIQSDHYLILSVAYSDGSGGYYYNNPDGFLDGGGDYPSGSSFEPGGGPIYVSTSYIYLGTTTVNISTAAPSITSISPNSVATGKSGTIEVEGNNLVDPFTNQTTPAVSGSGVNLSVAGTPSSNHVSLNYSVDSGASSGSRSLTVATRFGTSSGANLTVGYPPAVVTSLNPSVWQAGTNFTLTISGTGFGTAPTVYVSGAAGVSEGQAMNTSTDGTQTQVTVDVAAEAPDGTATVQVQPGYTGSSFTCGNCDGASPIGSDVATVVGTQYADSCSAASDSHSGFAGIVPTGTTVGESGTMTASFSGGAFDANSVTVPYGQYSTPESIAAHIAALVTKQYYNSGLSAQAFGPYVVYKSTAALGTPGLTASGSSFTKNNSTTACPAVNTKYILAVMNDSVTWVDQGLNHGRIVEYDLETWPTAQNPRGTPPSFGNAVVTEHLTNCMAYGCSSSGVVSGQFTDVLGNTSGSNAGVYVADRYFTVNATGQNLGHIMSFDRAGKHDQDHIEIHIPNGPSILNNYKNPDGTPKDISLP